eukprot:261750_1
MSISTDKTTIKQNAMSIKSQRQQRITTNKEQQQLEEDNKDKQIIFDALNRIRDRGITNTNEFTWGIMYYEHKKENHKQYNNDEKQNENNKINNKINKKDRISQLIDTKYDEMCRFGHGFFVDNKEDIGDSKCIKCGSMNERKHCLDCIYYDRDMCINACERYKHVYCKQCRIENAKNIKNRLKMHRFKASIIRNELLNNPSLEMDLLCNMPRRASVDSLIEDINKLQHNKRAQWFLFVMDLDYLKCWNTCIGHIKTDLLITQIGIVMKKQVK